MPSIELTDAQADRLETVRAELEAVFVGEYGTVRAGDAVEYLLDSYTPPEDTATSDADRTVESSDEPTDIVADAVGEESANDDETVDEDDDAAGAGSGPNRLQAMMNLLKTHDDKWEKSSGDAPYQVTLPDGGTKPARTKDDVRRLLFKHYR